MPQGTKPTFSYLEYCIVAVSLFAVLHFSVLHWELISESLPLNHREGSSIILAEAFQKEGFDALYNLGSYPELSYGYGPLQVLAGSAVQSLWPDDPYYAQRLLSGFLILLSAGLVGFSILRKQSWFMALLGVTWMYVIYASSPSVAASPDMLAVIFYVSGMSLILRFGTGYIPLLSTVLIGLVGLLAKPYVALIVPAVLIYTYLFSSPRRALWGAAFALLNCLIGYFVLSWILPTYFHCVFAIHSYYSTTVFSYFAGQMYWFLRLNFSLVIIFICCFNWKCWGSFQLRSLESLWDNKPLLAIRPNFAEFLALISFAVLAGKLAWHDGNFLSCFHHLLLPPLLVSVLTYKLEKNWMLILILSNLALLSLWRPKLPARTGADLQISAFLIGKSALVEPAFEPIARLFENVDVVDNGQAEYTTNLDLSTNSKFSSLTQDWLLEQQAKLKNGTYDYLLLAQFHHRRNLYYRGELSDLVMENYVHNGYSTVPIYFHNYMGWDEYGTGQAVFEWFAHKSVIKKNN